MTIARPQFADRHKHFFAEKGSWFINSFLNDLLQVAAGEYKFRVTVEVEEAQRADR
jgi:hypothetical protein